METLRSFKKARASPARSVSTRTRLKVKSMEISAVRRKRRETIDEELELIEMRYQQALALTNLEDLFAAGLFD